MNRAKLLVLVAILALEVDRSAGKECTFRRDELRSGLDGLESQTETKADEGHCSKEGLCRAAEESCCCQIHGGIPKCYSEGGKLTCHPAGENKNTTCASDGNTYRSAQVVLNTSCAKNISLTILPRGCCEGGNPEECKFNP